MTARGEGDTAAHRRGRKETDDEDRRNDEDGQTRDGNRTGRGRRVPKPKYDFKTMHEQGLLAQGANVYGTRGSETPGHAAANNPARSPAPITAASTKSEAEPDHHSATSSTCARGGTSTCAHEETHRAVTPEGKGKGTLRILAG